MRNEMASNGLSASNPSANNRKSPSDGAERVWVPGRGFLTPKPERVTIKKRPTRVARFEIGDRVSVRDSTGQQCMATVIYRGGKTNPPMARIDGRDEIAVINSHAICPKIITEREPET